ncbi:hypothetical protein SAMN05877753_102129 [Bacillus oleivorans]|uniref:Uncharacterized protein n=1 Tax=Bacillus oleivorans TaxID=1448271 RepID=A0A285CKN9_9BACI|nr:hypothetical protein [Bacillus oleivorans]SNX67925.1 hypothetical protein SAMN05877753_102129 [Bacillus oleivorans]
MLKNKWVFITITAFILAFTGFYWHISNKAEESFTYFPPDPTARYDSGYTTLTLNQKSPDGPYEISWKSQSSLDQKAFYRQDVALLFEGGRLKGKMGEWKQNVSDILQESTLFFKDSQLIQAITFHFSEIHRGEKIGSAQKLSSDFLYIIDSQFSPFESFRHPENEEEEKWKNTIDQVVRNRLEKSWRKAADKFNINLDQYQAFPLIQIAQFDDRPLPGFSLLETKKIVGQLWEGLYKNYYLGIKKPDGSLEDALDSIMPLILVAKDRTHLFVLTETKSGESIVLRQQID